VDGNLGWVTDVCVVPFASLISLVAGTR
jgi:hypothetical protein